MQDTTRYTTSTSLHAAILSAAVTAWDKAENPDVPYGHITFRHASGSIKLLNTKERLQQFASQMMRTKSTWALWGGGPMPAVQAKKRKTWQGSAVALCKTLFSDKDIAGTWDIAQNKLGGQVYDCGRGAFAIVAPESIEGLPEQFKSGWNLDAKRWVVYCKVTGHALGGVDARARTREQCEEWAKLTWSKATEETRSRAYPTKIIGTQRDHVGAWFAQHGATQPTPTPDEAEAQALAVDAVAAVAIDAAQTTERADELAEPEWSKKWAADMADTMAQIEAMKAEREEKRLKRTEAAAEVACMAEACADAVADGVACMPRAEHSGQPPSHTTTRAGFATPGSGQPSGTHAGSQPPAPRAEAAETRATPTATESEAQEKPTVATLVNAGIHPAIADTISRCGISAYGPIAQAEIRATLAAAEQAQDVPALEAQDVQGMPLVPHAHQEPIDIGNPTCRGKSGKWAAWLRMTWDNLHQLAFMTTPEEIAYSTYDTGSARMAALQRLAQSADKSNDFPNPGDEYSVYVGAWLRMKFLYKKEKTTTSNELYYFSNGSIATVVKVDELHERVKATTEADAGPSGTLTAPHTPTPSEPNGPDTHGVCAAGATDYTHPLKTLGGDYTDPLKTLTGDVHAKTANQPSHPRNIVPENGTRIAEDAFEAWTFHHEKSDRFGFVMYLGKQSKPYAYYAYATEAKRDAGFERHAQQARDILASKAKRKAEDRAKLDAGHGLQVGDVVRSSWGYDQTNVDHYQIIKVIGKRTVEVRALAVHEESTGDMSGRVAPVWGEFVGEVMRRQVDKHGNVNMLSASYGRASKIEPVAVVHGVRCYAATHYSSYA